MAKDKYVVNLALTLTGPSTRRDVKAAVKDALADLKIDNERVLRVVVRAVDLD